MASVSISSATWNTSSPIAAPTSEANTSRSRSRREKALKLLGALSFSALPLVCALLAQKGGYVSPEHAYLLEKASSLGEPGARASDFFEAPALSMALAWLFSSATALSVLSSIVGGVTIWLVWGSLRHSGVHPALCVAAVSTVLVLPATLRTITNSLTDVLTLFFLLFAWRSYNSFAMSGTIVSGVATGSIIAGGFFAHPVVGLFIIPYALAAPSYFRLGESQPTYADRKLQRRTALAGVAVVGLPVLFTFVTWIYLDWTLTGNALGFVEALEHPTLGGTSHDDIGWSNAVSASGDALLHSPLYLMVGLLILGRGLRQIGAYVFAPLVIAAVRVIGFPVAEGMATAVLAGFALVGVAALLATRRSSIHQRPFPRRWVLAVLCLGLILQFAVGIHDHRHPEGTDWETWRNALLD